MKYIIVTISFLVALGIRLLSLFAINNNGKILFISNDSYYHLRLSEHFGLPYNDPMFTIHNTWTLSFNLFDFILQVANRLFHSDIVLALIPPIIGALCVIPMYFLGKHLFNSRTTGYISSGLTAVAPGEFLMRSLAGYTDYHCLEVLLMTSCCLFFVLAIKKHEYFGLLCGVIYGLYIATWIGALLFAVMLVMYYAVVMFKDKIRDKKVHWRIAMYIFIGAISITTVLQPNMYAALSLCGFAVLVTLLLMVQKRHYLMIVPVTMVVGFLFIIAVLPYNPLDMILPTATRLTVSESEPFTFILAWNNLTFLMVLGPIGLLLILLRERTKDKLFLAIWFLLLLVLTLNMRRFVYYLSIPFILTSAMLIRHSYKALIQNSVLATGVMTALLLLATIPNLFYGIKIATNPPFIPSKQVIESMLWLKNNTPELPEYQEDTWVKLETQKQVYQVFVMWDYGYQVVREAHRIPTATPGAEIKRDFVSDLFSASSSEDIYETLISNRIRYVILDDETFLYKWHAIRAYATEPVDKNESFLYKVYQGIEDPVLRYSDGNISGYFMDKEFDNGKIKIYKVKY